MKRCMVLLILLVAAAGTAYAAAQDTYELPEPYIGLEKAYLKEFPQLQGLIDMMIETYSKQLKDPTQDILHVRICSALAYKMALDMKLSTKDRLLSVAADLFHDITKQNKKAVLTDPAVFTQSVHMIDELRTTGFLKESEHFGTDEKLLKDPSIGANLALIHHITGAVEAGRLLKDSKFQISDIRIIQAAIVGHSTGYWYFRDMVDQSAGYAQAWRKVFPEPAGNIALIAHDADLISQFAPESVVPNGSKWRLIAKNRWGAKTAEDEAHVVYYVFYRLFEEAKTEPGRRLAQEKWETIAQRLVTMMGLRANEDPIALKGVPAAFKK